MKLPLLSLLASLGYLQLATAGNILCWMSFGSKSHFIVMKPLLTALVKRNHTLTIVTPIFDKDLSKMDNVEFIYVPENDIAKVDSQAVFRGEDPTNNVTLFMEGFSRVQRQLHENDKIQRLLTSGAKFDVAILSMFTWDIGLYAAKAVFKAPVIYYAQVPRLFPLDRAIGNPTNPAYLPDNKLGYGQQMTFKERLVSTLVSGVISLSFDYLQGSLNEELRVLMNSDESPNLQGHLRDIDFLFYHRNPGYLVSPVTPNTILLGGSHLRPGKALPDDLQKSLDVGETIYVSFGSILVGSDLPKDKLNILLNVFSNLAPMKVLWKWETESMENKPDNVILKKWLPQQDVLGHPNVKLFITHGGQGSLDEALYHEVPTVVIPGMADQYANADLVERVGVGKKLIWPEVNEENLLKAILSAQDPSCRSKVEKYSSIFRDDLTPSLDRAVYYTEYAMRHQGARHLRAPYQELYLFQYLGLDVFAFLLAVFLLVLLIFYKCCRACCRSVCGGKAQKQKRS